MRKLINRIQKKVKILLDEYHKDLRFSNKLAVYRLLDEVLWRGHFVKFSAFFHKKKDEYIIRYLKNNISEILEMYQNISYIGEKVDICPIWVCWWTGEENAPELVKQCLKSVRTNAGNHPVKLITRDNYIDYIEIPSYILEKVEAEKMCVAHFADYIRISLLEKYGGLWLDATIYCAQQIPEEYFEYPFFTCKSKEMESRYLSKLRWTGFCLGGWKGNTFYSFLKKSLEHYWNTEEYAIDYLFMDYIFEIAYRFLPVVQKCIDDVPLNNLKRDELQNAMNMALPGDSWNKIIDKNTCLYKLSWREKYSTKTENGKESIYAFFLKLDIEKK